MYQKNKIMVSLVFLIFIFSLGNICNAAISNARPIQLNTPVKGSLPDRNTKNYYAIDLHDDGYIRIDFEHENLTDSSVGWNIILYNDESKKIESFNSRWNSPQSSSANIGLPAGTYYILVEYPGSGGRHSNADYILKANYNQTENQPIGDETENDIEDEEGFIMIENESEQDTSDEISSEAINLNTLVENNDMYISIGVIVVIIIVLSTILYFAKAKIKG